MAKHPHGIQTEKPPKTKNIWGTIKRIWQFLAVKKLILNIIFILIAISVVLSLLGPYLIGVAVDQFIVTRTTEGLLKLLIFLGLIYIFNSLAIWLQNHLMIGIAQDTIYTMRRKLFRHLHLLPISFFDKKQHGEEDKVHIIV